MTNGRLLSTMGFLVAALMMVGGACGSSSNGTGTAGSGGAGTGGAGSGGAGSGGAGSGGAGSGGAGAGGAGTGGAGTMDASTDAATDASSDTSADAASEASSDTSSDTASTDGAAPTTAQATIAAFGTGTITGTAAFTNVANGVQVVITLANCPAGAHGIHIHAGTGCADATAQGAHWGPTRGEGIVASADAGGTGEIVCAANGTATLTYTRTNANPDTAWTIGGPAATNVIGHPIVVHGLVATNREGCGLIQ